MTAAQKSQAETLLDAPPSRGKLESEKARRIVAAMRESVGLRGAGGSTFDQVAQEAGVSRGLLHYYFGSKERLLVEVVRHDCDVRMAALDAAFADAGDVESILEVLMAALEDLIDRDPASYALIFELFSASRQNEELREQLAELYQRVREHVAGLLERKQDEGVVKLRGDAPSVSAILFALADGLALQRLSDPAWDSGQAFEVGLVAARFLLAAD